MSGQVKQSNDMLEESWCGGGAAGYNKGIWIHAADHTNPVVGSSRQMVLIKDVRRQLFLSYGGESLVCARVCQQVCVCVQ